jgi:hypothetical protein
MLSSIGTREHFTAASAALVRFLPQRGHNVTSRGSATPLAATLSKHHITINLTNQLHYPISNWFNIMWI